MPTAALCQLAPVIGDIEANTRTALGLLRSESADLLVLPELFLTGYSAAERAAELAPAAWKSALRIHEAAREAGKAMVLGLPVEGDHRGVVYNGALVAGLPEGPWAYRKIHLPNFGPFREKEHFAHGDDVRVFAHAGMRFGLAVCYDVFFPEVYRAAALAGADAIVTIAASPAQSRPLFERLVPARAIETTCYHLFANLVGTEGGLEFWGGSRLCSPLGDELAAAPVGGEGVVRAELDEGRVRADRQARPVLGDILLQGWGGAAASRRCDARRGTGRG